MDIITKCTKNPEIWHVMDLITIINFGLFFFNSTENLNFKKIYEKTSGEHKCTEN